MIGKGYNFIVTADVRRTATRIYCTRIHRVTSYSLRHIPTKVYDEFQGQGKPEPSGKIPGYAGYVHAIKSENLHADTFGKTTRNVETDTFVKGQDFESRDKYVTTNTSSYMPPSERFQRTAADIVGVPPTQIKVQPVHLQ